MSWKVDGLRRSHVASFLILCGIVPTVAQSAESASLEARAVELERIRDEIAVLTGRLAKVREETAELEGDLERLSLERQLQERRVAEAIAAARLAQERLEASQQALLRLQAELERERASLADRLTGLYRLGRHGALRLFLAVDRAREVLPAVRWARYLSRREARTVERFEILGFELDRERQERESAERQARAWLEAEKQRRQELSRLEAEWTRRLQARRKESRGLLEEALSLAEAARKLGSFLATLTPSGERAALPGVPMQQFQGLLDWPVRGRVRIPFGPRMDPRYGTRVPHHGIELETTPGQPVEVVYGGQVAFAAPFEGYGKTVIVVHPGGVVSLYAQLAELSVERGAMVSLRMRLGTTGSRFYFEIRLDQRPTNPESWMREPLK